MNNVRLKVTKAQQWEIVFFCFGEAKENKSERERELRDAES
jgi:hypothetical protein